MTLDDKSLECAISGNKIMIVEFLCKIMGAIFLLCFIASVSAMRETILLSLAVILLLFTGEVADFIVEKFL